MLWMSSALGPPWSERRRYGTLPQNTGEVTAAPLVHFFFLSPRSLKGSCARHDGPHVTPQETISRIPSAGRLTHASEWRENDPRRRRLQKDRGARHHGGSRRTRTPGTYPTYQTPRHNAGRPRNNAGSLSGGAFKIISRFRRFHNI